MDFTERRRYLRIMHPRKERSALLDEIEAVTKLHCKAIICLLNALILLERKARKRERGPIYGPKVRAAVARIAQALDYPTAERLQPALASLASLLIQHGELEGDEPLPTLPVGGLRPLATISVSTVRRIMAGPFGINPVRR